MKRNVEERLARVEQMLENDGRISRIEIRSMRFAQLILFILALAALVLSGLFGFVSFVIHLLAGGW